MDARLHGAAGLMGKLIVLIVLGYLTVTSGSDIRHDGFLQDWQHPPTGCHFVYTGRTVAWTWRRTTAVLCWRTATLTSPSIRKQD